MEISPQSETSKFKIIIIVPCQEFDYGFMKHEIQSPESPVKSLPQENSSLVDAVKRMEQKAVGFILATAVKSDINQPKYKETQQYIIQDTKRIIKESMDNIQVNNTADINQVSNSEQRVKAQEKSQVNYTAKTVYRYQFEASPPDWIGVWEGKSRKFPIPPNTSVLHFAFMGGVLSRMDDLCTSNEDQTMAPTIYKMNNQKTLKIPSDFHEFYGTSIKEPLISSEEYKIILVQTVNSRLCRHWKRNEESSFCKICNIDFNWFTRKHHCRL